MGNISFHRPSDLEGSLMPLEDVSRAFLAGNATVFILRIQKAASSVLDELFLTADESGRECSPNMRALEGPTCNRLFNLLHYGWVGDDCGGMVGWDE
jgi:hypothetical protein